LFVCYWQNDQEDPMRLVLIALPLLAACVPPPDSPGEVTAFNGNTVTIRSGGDFSLAGAGKGFKPTPAVVAQAQEVCPGAKFTSGIGVESDAWLVDYLFICP
jgi:hypothetical protein